MLFTLGSIALCQFARAVTPAPDGGYPNGTTAEGQNALQRLTGGINNTALGYQALYHDTTGSNNAATGLRALFGNTTGANNTANGSQALASNTSGNYNVADGYVALSANTSGGSNTAVGAGALHGNTTASRNTALGYVALYNNTTGSDNTAIGDRALYSNASSGYENTAIGSQALSHNTAGGQANTATGYRALDSNITGTGNSAFGWEALPGNTTGIDNTAIGIGALANVFFSGNENIALGAGSGSDLLEGDNNIYIGNRGCCVFSGESNTIRIGDPTVSTATAFIAGIHGAPIANGAAVYVSSDGQLGNSTSSACFKEEIRNMGQTSEAVLALRPVIFRYKKEIDPKGISQFGLVAEEVEKVNPDLVVRDTHGKPYSVRYDHVNAMLLNEFLKEHKKVQQLEAASTQQRNDFEARIAELRKEIAGVVARSRDQDEKIQKVSAQVELNKTVSRAVANK